MSHLDNIFSGKRALVTGGAQGIGREIAQLLHRCGAKTIVIDMSSNGLESLKQEIQDIEVIEADLTNWELIEKVVHDILPIDLLVNNAGVGYPRAFLEYEETDIDKIFNVNYKAAFLISQIIAKDLIGRNEAGSIVNISSGVTMRHFPPKSIYGPSKAALDSLTKYMAHELGPQKIRVNAVNPIGIATAMTGFTCRDPVRSKYLIKLIPLGRLGEKREIADVVAFLLSDKASFVNGITMAVDGGHAF